MVQDGERKKRRCGDGDEVGLFDAAPVALWLQDLSAVKAMFDTWRGQGVLSPRQHLLDAPDRLRCCVASIRLVKVNRKTVDLLEATGPAELLCNLERVWGAELDVGFVDGFEQLWAGAGEFLIRVESHTLTGRRIVLELRGTILPGAERSWDAVMVAAADVTSQDDAQRQALLSENYARGLFDHSPVSLWLEDGSRLLALFESWRAEGVLSLREHLSQNPECIVQCAAAVGVVTVNRKTLTMYEADDLDQLVSNLVGIFGEDAMLDMMDNFEALWNGNHEYTCNTVNYTLSGRRLDVQIWGRILPGYERTWQRFLLVIEDVTERETARRLAGVSEAYARRLFEHSPVALAVDDYSEVKRILDGLRADGVEDLAAFLDTNPDVVDRCVQAIRVVDLNRRALELYKAPDIRAFVNAIDRVLGDPGRASLRFELVLLWEGELLQQREVVNYALDGTRLHLRLQWSVFPGHEEDWSLVQIGLMDITARKEAEARIEFLNSFDELTGLHNRAFFTETLTRLDREERRPVSIIVLDLNGLKSANDQWGHSAGDELLRRAGEVLTACSDYPAARIGGDEFVVLMPDASDVEGERMVERIRIEILAHNLSHAGSMLSLSLGVATSQPGERLAAVVNRADAAMYEDKRRHYSLNQIRAGSMAPRRNLSPGKTALGSNAPSMRL